MKTRQYIIIGVSAILILVIGFALMGFFSGMKTPEKKAPPRTTATNVLIEPVQYREIETELEYLGRVGSFQQVALIAEVQGDLLRGSVPLKEGQAVRQGQLLFRIDDREARLSLQSNKSQFQKAIADILADLKIDYPDYYPQWQAYFDNLDVTKPLPDLPATSSSQEKTFISTRGIYSTYYTILAAEERLSNYRMYAPFSGTLTNVQLEAGSVVNPGTRIGNLVRTSKLELVLPVRDEDLRWLNPGTEVTVKNEAGTRTWKGKISRLGEQVDVATQSVNVYVTLQGTSENPVLQGQYLKATLPGKVVRRSMEIPRRALFDKNKVYMVKDSILQSMEVTVHKENPTTAIISGLPENSDLVVEIPLNAEEGLAVNPTTETK